MKKPNTIFLFSDRQRWDTLGCYGQPLNVTPNQDAMAAEGTRFHNHSPASPYAARPGPACSPGGNAGANPLPGADCLIDE